MTPEDPILRLATPGEADEIDALMKSSTREIFPNFYNERQTESAILHVAAVDRMLIDDGTYFVVETSGDLVACGGWSRRDKLYSGPATADSEVALLDPTTQPARVRAMFVRADWTRRGLGMRILGACEEAAKTEGFHALALMATLPGLPLYERYGFRVVERVDMPLADGTTLPGAAMEKAID
jgi:GNAT superfamily N-acetyltransferase